MKHWISLFQLEARHLIGHPFKLISLLLFIGAALYGLQNGYALFQRQQVVIQGIENRHKESIAELNAWYDAGKKGPEDKPWIDITTPSRAIAYAPAFAAKRPSPLLPFSIGQADQFGYYKEVTPRSTLYDTDLAEEIANPELLTSATVDFSFVLLYLLPVLSILLLFNVGGLEKDLGFEELIEVNYPHVRQWLLIRFSFYFFLLQLLILLLMLAYALPSGALVHAPSGFFLFYMHAAFYTLLWFGTFYFINLYGRGSAAQAIQMAAVWLVFCIILPGTMHQLSSLKHPTNYMTSYLDASRKETYRLYELPIDTLRKKLIDTYPHLSSTLHAKDTLPDQGLIYTALPGLSNLLLKDATRSLETASEAKNDFIKKSAWLNPVSWFQNKMNALAETDYYAYQRYRSAIQLMIDRKIAFLMKDSWNKEVVDKQRYRQYIETFLGNDGQ